MSEIVSDIVFSSLDLSKQLCASDPIVFKKLFNINFLVISENIFLISALFLAAVIIVISYFLFNKCKKCCEADLVIKNLEKQNESKDRFFSIIAHDLKSPFNSLVGISEMLMLQSDSLNTEQVLDYSKMVHQSTTRLYTLVDNLLQWSRTQLGTTEYRPEKLDINITTENVVNLLRLSAQEKDIVISVRMEDELMAFADTNLFSAVLRNLINNSIKFSKVGSIIQVYGQKRNDGMIEIEVADQGVGMEKTQLDNLFKIDYNGSTVGTFNEKGTGLGLILCKEFVEINKGDIEIESEIGKGTTVKFTIPSESFNLN